MVLSDRTESMSALPGYGGFLVLVGSPRHTLPDSKDKANSSAKRLVHDDEGGKQQKMGA